MGERKLQNVSSPLSVLLCVCLIRTAGKNRHQFSSGWFCQHVFLCLLLASTEPVFLTTSKHFIFLQLAPGTKDKKEKEKKCPTSLKSWLSSVAYLLLSYCDCELHSWHFKTGMYSRRLLKSGTLKPNTVELSYLTFLFWGSWSHQLSAAFCLAHWAANQADIPTHSFWVHSSELKKTDVDFAQVVWDILCVVTKLESFIVNVKYVLPEHLHWWYLLFLPGV